MHYFWVRLPLWPLYGVRVRSGVSGCLACAIGMLSVLCTADRQTMSGPTCQDLSGGKRHKAMTQ